MIYLLYDSPALSVNIEAVDSVHKSFMIRYAFLILSSFPLAYCP